MECHFRIPSCEPKKPHLKGPLQDQESFSHTKFDLKIGMQYVGTLPETNIFAPDKFMVWKLEDQFPDAGGHLFRCELLASWRVFPVFSFPIWHLFQGLIHVTRP